MSMYDYKMVIWMEKELANIGVKPLKTSKEVDDFFNNKEKTSLVMINSVCGCAAGGARPGLGLALQNNMIPDNIATVFAGVDPKATALVRKYLNGYPPSSPSMALLKDGKIEYFLPRSEIEGFSYEQIAEKLMIAFNIHCTAKGPSVSFEQLKSAFLKSPN